MIYATEKVKAFDGDLVYDPNDEILTFIHLTDTHVKGENDDLTLNFENAIETVNLIDPDFLFITGDIADAGYNENYQSFISIINTLNPGIRWYTVLGNHDYYLTPLGPIDDLEEYNKYIPPNHRLSDRNNWFTETGYRFIGFDSVDVNDETSVTGMIDSDELYWFIEDFETIFVTSKYSIAYRYLPLRDTN